MKKVSQQWHDELNEFLKSKNDKFYFLVYDPDGWDRSNYQFSYHEEEITKEEFCNRTMSSTCMQNCGVELIIEWGKQ